MSFPRAQKSGLVLSLVLAAATLLAAPRLQAQNLTPAGYLEVDVSSLAVGWDSTFNPGTLYYAAISSGDFPNSFTGNATSNTLNGYAGFTGLSPDVVYYTAVATDAAGPYTFLGTATTLAAAPGFDASGDTFSSVTTTGLAVVWSSGTAAEGYNPSGTTYQLDASVAPDFGSIAASVQTPALSFATPTGMSPDTTYYVRVAALNPDSVLSAYTVLGATSTLAVAPGPAADTFSFVSVSGLSVSWSSGDAAGYDGDGTLYTVQLSTKSDFSLLWASSQTAALTQSFAGLDANRTYYARVQALNNGGGATAFTSLGSTVTSTAAGLAGLGFFDVGSSSFSAAWFSAYPAGTTYYTTVSTGPLPNVFSGNVSSVTLNLSALLTGLTANASYYARTSTAASGPYTDLGATSTLAADPGYDAAVGSFTEVTTGGLVVHWASGTPAGGYNAAGTSYVAAISTDPAFQAIFAVTSTTDTAFGDSSGLVPDTTYYAAVAALSLDGQQTGYDMIGATSTLAVAPAAPPGGAFSGVGLAALSVSWASGTAAGYDGAGTWYVAQISTMASFAPVWGSSQTADLNADFSGLDPNKTYYARVQALNNSGGGTAFASLGSTVTTADAGLGAAPMLEVGSSSFTASWTSAFGSGVTYYARVSSAAFPNSFSGNASSDTLNLSATFTGLTPNTSYFAEVSTDAAGPFTSLGSTSTVAAPPGQAAQPFTAFSTAGFSVSWTSGTAAAGYDPAGTLYKFQAAGDPSFSAAATVVTTLTTLPNNQNLSLDTLYYLRVAALDNDGTQSGGFTDLGSTSTLAAAPSAPASASTFTAVYSSSFTVNWSSGSAASGGYNPAGALYFCQISEASDFSSVAASSLTTSLAVAFTGLTGNTQYFARVEALSQSGAATAFADLGSTTTLSTTGIDPAGFSGVDARDLTVAWQSGFAPGETYYADLSTGPFPNSFSGNASSATLNLSASFASLAPASRYYLRISTNSGAGPYADLGSTATWAVAPAAPAASTFTALSSSGLTLNWSSGTAAGGYDAAGTLYLARLSTASDFATLAASSQTANVFAAFSGLTADVTYYAQVRAANPAGTATAFADFGSAATPAAAPVAPTAPFLAVAPSSVTLSWTSADALGTTYYAQVSPVSNFSSAVASSKTYATSAVFTGLALDATYYARVAAYDVVSGTWTAFTGLQSTITWAAIPAAPAGSTFTAVSAQALTLHWSSGTAADGYDPAGTLYLAQVSQASDFSSPASSRTYNLSADFSGLSPDSSYYARVEALNGALMESGFLSLGSTATPAAVPSGPAAGASTFTALSGSGLTVNWSSGTAAGGYDPADALYLVELSTDPAFASLTASQQAAGLAAVFSGLSANGTYYAQVAALGRDGGATSFAALGATSTLAVTPSSPPGGSTFTLVFASSLTVSWSSGTEAGGYNPPGTLYALELSTSPGFGALAASSQTYSLSATVTGLEPLTTYYARARAFNALLQPTAFLDLGSTETASDGIVPAGFSAVGSNGLTAAWLSSFGAGTPYTAEVSTGALPNSFSGNRSSATLNVFAALTGLEPNATYYAQVSTSATGLYTSLGSTQTLAAAPAAPAGASTFTAVSVSGFSLNWSSGSAASGFDPAGTLYLARVSTAASFSPVLASSWTYGLSAGFSGLSPGSAYFAQVQAFNGAGTPTAFASLGSTITPAALPAAASPAFSAVSATALSAAWTDGVNLPGTTYYAQLSTAADFASVTASSATFSLSAAFAGLTPDSTYYARAAAFDAANSTWTAFTDLGSTITAAVAPAAPAGVAFESVLASGFTLSWSSGTGAAGYDPPGTEYLAQISTRSDFSPLWSSSQTVNLFASFTGLDAAATYYAQVQALGRSGTDTAFADLGSTVTAAAPTLVSAGFSAVGSAGLTASWLSGFAPGQAYYAVLSTGALPNAFSGNQSSTTLNLFAAFTGLAANATYYAQASTDAAGPYTPLGSTVTLAVAPAAPVGTSSFTSVFVSSLAVNWSSGTEAGGYDPAGTLYVVELATASDFSSLTASSSTYSLSAAFTGLQGSATYYARARARNAGGTPTAFALLGSTITRSGQPGLVGTVFSNLSSSGLTAAWLGNSPPETYYDVQLATSADFTTVTADSQTLAESADFSGLSPNATYYAQAAAYDAGSSAWTAFTALGSTATLAVAPGSASSTFTAVTGTALTVGWSSGTQAGGYDPVGTYYVAQLSTDPGFAAVRASSRTLGLSASFSGLSANATYYARAQARNADEVATAFASLGSTWTPVQLPGSLAGADTFTAVSQSGLTVAWSSGSAAGGFDAVGTAYVVELSTMASFSPLAASSQTLNAWASFTGLTHLTTYYAQVRALGADGSATAFVGLGSTETAGGIAPAGFGGVSAAGLSALWSSVFPSGTLYYAQLSSAAFPNSFSGNQSSDTFNSFAGFTGLTADSTYFLQVASAAAGPFWDLGSTITLAAVPGAPAGAPFSSVSTGDLAVAWSSGTAAGGYNPLGGTLYLAQISTDAAFAAAAASTRTYGLSAVFGGLGADATYYARVQAFNHAGAATAFADLGSTSTLAVPPGPAASTFTAVTGNGLTLNWSSGTAAVGFNAAGTAYLAQLSTDAAFGTLTASSRTFNLDAAFSGLAPNAAYYARAQALGNGGLASAFTSYGSTATPTAVPGAAAFSAVAYTSVTVNWLSNANPAGTTYYAQISTAADFSAVIASSRTYNLDAVFTGLGVNTTYYAQAAAYSLNTSTWTAFTPLGSTSTLANAPAAAALGQVFVSSLSFSWSANGDPAWTSYVAQISSDGFSTVAASSRTLLSSATFFGLTANATYFLRVRALNGGGTPTDFAALPSTWTDVAAPSSSAASAVGSSSATVTWGAAGNAASTLYLAQLSADSGFASVDASSMVASTTATFAGLAANTTYYFRVQAVGNGGRATAFTPLPPVTTLLLPPAAAASGFASVSATGLTAAWAAGGNGPGTTYDAELSTDGFTTVSAASSTLNLSASFAGLLGNEVYAARTRTTNGGNASAYLDLGSTRTLAVPPAAAASTFTAVTGNSLTVNWSSGSAAGGYDAAGTLYVAQLSTDAAFGTLTDSSQTYSLSAAFSGLGASAVYHARVQALNGDGLASAFVDYGSTATPTAVPGAAPMSEVAYTSATVNWLADGNPAGTTYYVQLSTTPGFTAVLASSQTCSLDAVFTGLGLNTAYYGRVAAYSLNAGTWTTFAALGSTVTLAEPPAAPALAQVGVSTLSFTWSAAGDPAWTEYEARISTDGFATLTASSRTLLTSATFFGLTGNATYFLEVRALNGGGTPTDFTALPSTWTDVAAPSAAPPSSVGSSSVTVAWGAAGNAAGTLYVAQASLDGFASVAAASSTYADSAALTGLLANAAYAFRVQAVGNDGRLTAFTALPSTTTLLLPPAAAAQAFASVETSSVTVLWAGGGDGPGTTYQAQLSTDAFATVNAASGTLNLSALFGAGGFGPSLAPNTTYYARVRASAGASLSSFLDLGSTITLALPPTGTAVSGVAPTSATVSWSLGLDPAPTVAQVQQSTDGVSFTPIFAGAATTLADGGLLQCTTYWVRVRAQNGAGLFTAFDAAASFVTKASTPVPALALAAEPVSGNRVTLSWTPSPSEGISGYRLFYDAGTGAVSYAAPLAVLTSTETSFTTGVLASSGTYLFALRAGNRCGVEESTGVFASAGSTATLAALRAAVTAPDSGKHIAGNDVSVVASLVSGVADRAQDVRFQYRPSGTSPWTDLVSADASHPNPAASQPFYIHWDVTGLASGSYDLRAVATDVDGSTDTTPAGITVVVDPVTPDISETVVGGQTKKVQTINTAVTNVIQVAGSGADDLLTKIVMPAGALTSPTVAVTVTSNFTLPSLPPAGVSVVGNAMQVSLSNGQSLLAGGLTAPVTLSYPATESASTVLQIYTLNEGTGKWSKDFSSTADPLTRTVTGATPHFSVFVIVNAGTIAPDLSRVRVWPNPFKPFGGNPDEGRAFNAGDPASGIVFDNLPATASLRIYTITGQLVAHLDSVATNGRIQWDARNDASHDVASGVYMAVISSPGMPSVVRKVAILR